MAQVLSLIISLVYWICTIVLCVKGKFKFAIPMIFLSLTAYPMVLGLICQYSLSQNFSIASKNFYLLYAIALIVLALFLLSFFIPISKEDKEVAEKPPTKRWFFLLGGFSTNLIGIMVTLMFWYTPNVFGKAEPMPLYGTIANNIGVVGTACFFYLAAKYNSYKRPNLMRKLVILTVYLLLHHLPLVLSLILLYSFPITPSSIFPTEAGLNMISSIVWALLLIFLQRKVVIDIPVCLDLEQKSP
jgi:hypothetical protein